MSPKRSRPAVESDPDEELVEALVRAFRRALRLTAAEQSPPTAAEVVVEPASVREGTGAAEVPDEDRCVALKRGSHDRCKKRRSGARFCPSHYDWVSRGGRVIDGR